MKCLMFGLACDQEQFERYITKNKNPYSVAHYLFEMKFIESFEKEFKISHNYILQSKNRFITEAIVKAKKAKLTVATGTTYLNYVNFPFLKFITLFISTYERIWQFKEKNSNDFFILSTINYMPVALATCLFAHIYKCKNIIIFTDCSTGYAFDHHESTLIKRFLLKLYKRIVHSIEQQYDAYILFTEAMNELVNHKKKSYCVMEGFFNSAGLNLTIKEKYKKFVILYAGTLLESFGIQNIIDALKKIDNQNIELWIAGDGPYKENLIKRSSGDIRIKFLGYIEHAALFDMEKKVSLVINTRDPELAYTKYSFPSKTFEYLASGTPFLSTKLACYSEEYEQYIWFIEDNSAETIAKEINILASKKQTELSEFGAKAKTFIETKKTPEAQVQKVIDFLREFL